MMRHRLDGSIAPFLHTTCYVAWLRQTEATIDIAAFCEAANNRSRVGNRSHVIYPWFWHAGRTGIIP